VFDVVVVFDAVVVFDVVVVFDAVVFDDVVVFDVVEFDVVDDDELVVTYYPAGHENEHAPLVRVYGEVQVVHYVALEQTAQLDEHDTHELQLADAV